MWGEIAEKLQQHPRWSCIIAPRSFDDEGALYARVHLPQGPKPAKSALRWRLDRRLCGGGCAGEGGFGGLWQLVEREEA